jgi:hypothetical protein
VLEVPIEYRMRGGEVKLNAMMDGLSNLRSLFQHRLRGPIAEAPAGTGDIVETVALPIPAPANRSEAECERVPAPMMPN